MGDWTSLTIVEMVSRGFNGQFVEKDYITMQMSAVPGFPQLFYRVYGDFNFISKMTSNDVNGTFVAAGSPITSIEVIDVNGTVFSRLDGINFSFNSDKTTFAIEPVNAFANSFAPGENPEEATLLNGNDYLAGSSGTEVLFGFGGNDEIYGLAGIDGLHGGAGNDTLNGGADADDLYGDAGNDTIVGYTTGDYIDGGADFDTWALTGVYSTGIGLSPQRDYRSVNFYNIEAIKITYGDIVLNSNQVGGTSTVQTIIAGSIYRDSLVVSVVPGGSLNLANVTFTDWNNYSGEFDRITLLGSSGADLIQGSQKNDFIWGYEGANTLYGNSGDDTMRGAEFSADILFGGNGADTLYGFGGNDTLIGDDNLASNPNAIRGDDTLYGGGGADSLSGLAGFNMIDGGDGVDTVDYRFTINTLENGISYPVTVYIDLSRVVDFNNPGASAVTTYIDVRTPEISSPVARDIIINVENVEGSAYGDDITGNAEGNRLRGWGGIDLISGLGGNDVIDGGIGIDTMLGGDGNDTYYANVISDVVTENNAVLTTGGNDIVVFTGTVGTFTLSANVERLLLSGASAINGTGNGLANTIVGNGAANSLSGLDGNDVINGGAGIDTMLGGLGNDQYYVDVAGDIVTEAAAGGTSDRVLASVNYVLAAATQIELLTTTNTAGLGAINLTGNAFNQIMHGNGGANVLNGGAGNNTISGFGGADIFVFNTALNAATNMDTITDFNAAADTIRLENAIFTLLATTGALAANLFKNLNLGAQDADDRILYNDTTGAIIYDSNGLTAGGQTQFALLTGSPTVTAADFVVI